MKTSINTIISGSFRKHLREIQLLSKALEEEGITVLSPISHSAANPHEEFVILESDPIDHPKILQDSVFAKIRTSAFIVVANVGGYLGAAATLEIGYAISQGIDIYTLEEVSDPNIAPYCKRLEEAFPNISLAMIDMVM